MIASADMLRHHNLKNVRTVAPPLSIVASCSHVIWSLLESGASQQTVSTIAGQMFYKNFVLTLHGLRYAKMIIS